MGEIRYECPECGSDFSTSPDEICDVCIQTLINLEVGQ